ncbi:hypothetical protein GGS20DRAFT_536751 [Poronia punctata]|nr:hypothetical protein GGS20DRAFT_536751 [Poronia punctata]
MRTTVACERCRRSKVKCHHAGERPCRGCLRSGNSETCVLTPTLIQRTSTRPRKRSVKLVSPPTSAVPTPGKHDYSSDLATAFAKVNVALFSRAVTTFRARFPECGFRHAHDLERFSGDISDVEKLRLLAILVICARYLGEEADVRRVEHAALLTRELQCRMTAPPSLCLIQCFLIMAIYEWGENIGHSAWMYAGIAARMAQVYRAGQPDTAGPDGKMGTNRTILSEVEVRTVWTSFVIDKLLSCGQQRPAMMRPGDLNVRMPQSEEDFVFGTEPSVLLSFDDIMSDASLRKHVSGSGFQFGILVRGLDIWHEIHSWIVDGGRKLPHMTESENCPWKPTSRWARLKAQLRCWREDQDPRLRYPDTKVSAHVHFRQGEAFAYINLLFYLSTVFICREFKPFLPVAEREPRGPIDPPFFPEDAPPGWWRHNADELFDAVAQISYLMRDLNSLGTPLHTPFTGLCVFTAAVMNDYVVAFPVMHRPQESDLRRRLAAENQADLEDIARLWKVGHKWLHVLGVMRNLYDRVIDNRAQGISRSRYDYVEFENSIHCAPDSSLLGRDELVDPHPHPHPHPKTTTTTTTITPVMAGTGPNNCRRVARAALDEESQHSSSTSSSMQPPAQIMTELMSGLNTDDFPGDDWRLWSFWDDPHLHAFDASAMDTS